MNAKTGAIVDYKWEKSCEHVDSDPCRNAIYCKYCKAVVVEHRPTVQEMKQACWKDMVKFIENSRRDSTPDVPAYETLTVMLQTLNDIGIEDFGFSEREAKALVANGEGERK